MEVVDRDGKVKSFEPGADGQSLVFSTERRMAGPDEGTRGDRRSLQ
jgi:hypothetical protein